MSNANSTTIQKIKEKISLCKFIDRSEVDKDSSSGNITRSRSNGNKIGVNSKDDESDTFN